MSEFTVGRWRRHGHDRLYVNRKGAEKAVGWYDFKTGEVVIDDEAHRAAVLDALAPHLPAAGAVRKFPQGPPDDGAEASSVLLQSDLSLNKPGESLRRKIAEEEPSWWKRRFAYWLPKERTPAHSWAVGLRGEQIVGDRLNLLRRDGWKVLHAVQLPSGTDIDHLVIGPPGVFSVNTKHHRGAALWQGNHAITVNRSKTGYVPISESEAAKVSRLLSGRCGFSVPVLPVIAVVGAASIKADPGLASVLLVDGARIDQRLSGRTATLSADRIETIFNVSRDGRTWLG